MSYVFNFDTAHTNDEIKNIRFEFDPEAKNEKFLFLFEYNGKTYGSERPEKFLSYSTDSINVYKKVDGKWENQKVSELSDKEAYHEVVHACNQVYNMLVDKNGKEWSDEVKKLIRDVYMPKAVYDYDYYERFFFDEQAFKCHVYFQKDYIWKEDPEGHPFPEIDKNHPLIKYLNEIIEYKNPIPQECKLPYGEINRDEYCLRFLQYVNRNRENAIEINKLWQNNCFDPKLEEVLTKMAETKMLKKPPEPKEVTKKFLEKLENETNIKEKYNMYCGYLEYSRENHILKYNGKQGIKEICNNICSKLNNVEKEMKDNDIEKHPHR